MLNLAVYHLFSKDFHKEIHFENLLYTSKF